MSYRIDVHNFQKRISLDGDALRVLISQALQFLKVSSAELSLAIVTDRKIHSLNKRYLAHDYPTDVITFDLSDGRGSLRKKGRSIDGEIIVSATTAFRVSKELGIFPAAELTLYAVHGILHLLGYDDQSEAERKVMRRKEQVVMRALGFQMDEGRA